LLTDKRSFDEFQDGLRKRLLPYLRRAFHQIPLISKPQILDIGCGSGVPTLELVRLSGGEVTAIDIDSEALQRLEAKTQEAKLGDRVHILKKSLKRMDFPDARFDILWSEGSIFVIGFKSGLKAWKRFLKPSGYLVVHDAVGNLDQKRLHAASCGYQLVDWFILGDEVWWHEYYEPLTKCIQKSRQQTLRNTGLLTALSQAEREICGYQKHPERYRSVYFIMRKE